MKTVKAQHMPGPWTVKNGKSLYIKHGRNRIARIEYSMDSTPEANAALIAAAPALLEALQELLKPMPHLLSKVLGENAQADIEERIEKAEAAIKSALPS